MKRKRSLSMILLVVMVVGILFGNTFCVFAAAKPKLNKTKVTTVIGKVQQLSVSGSEGRVQWKSSNPKIAYIPRKFNTYVHVVPRKVGKCYIYATIGKTTLKCKMIVKKAASNKPYLNYTKNTMMSGYGIDLKVYGGKVSRWYVSDPKKVDVWVNYKNIKNKKSITGTNTITVINRWKSDYGTTNCTVYAIVNGKKLKCKLKLGGYYWTTG